MFKVKQLVCMMGCVSLVGGCALYQGKDKQALSIKPVMDVKHSAGDYEAMYWLGRSRPGKAPPVLGSRSPRMKKERQQRISGSMSRRLAGILYPAGSPDSTSWRWNISGKRSNCRRPQHICTIILVMRI